MHNAVPAVQALALAVVVLNNRQYRLVFDIKSSNVGRMELPSAIVTLGTIRPEDSGDVF